MLKQLIKNSTLSLCAGLLFPLMTAASLNASELAIVTDNVLPTGAAILAFENSGNEGGFGWYKLDGAERNVAFSFSAPGTASLRNITLKVRRLAGGTIVDQPYTLRVIETDSLSIGPEEGREVARYQANMNIDPAGEFYLTFVLPTPVELNAGATYLIELTWETPSLANHIEFAALDNYRDGFIWKKEQDDDRYTRLTDSHRPGFLFHLY